MPVYYQLLMRLGLSPKSYPDAWLTYYYQVARDMLLCRLAGARTDRQSGNSLELALEPR